MAFSTAVAARSPFQLYVAHNAASLTATLADGRLGNAYSLRVENRDRAAHRLRLSLDAPAGFDLLAGVNPVELEPTSTRELRVFVAAPQSAPDGEIRAPIAFALSDVEQPALRVQRGATFLFEREEHHE